MTELDSGPDAVAAEPVTLITLFAVPPAETEQFLRHWRYSAGIMAAQPGFVRARLHQALDDAVEMRFVNIAQWSSGTALDQARTNPEFRAEAQRVLDAPQLHVAGRPGVYQIALVLQAGEVREPTHDDVRNHYRPSRGTQKNDNPASVADPVVPAPVILINPFTVSPAESERFLQQWWYSAEIMASHPGTIGGHLYRALDDAVALPFVNIAQFDSETAYDRTRANHEWPASVQWMQNANLHAIARPALYEVALEVHPGDQP